MNRGIKIGAIAVGGVAAGIGVAAAVASMRWGRATARSAARLEAQPRTDRTSLSGTTFSPARLAGLPAPVVRYFDTVLEPGQPLVRGARVWWQGEFRTSPNGRWSPFTAEQHWTTHPPGFVWDASIHMAPLLSVRVRDTYIAGEGIMLGKLAALVPVADQRGTPEIAAGALARYLGEAVWVPTALLPSEGVSWSPIDDSTARATLTDHGTTVVANFHFDATGRITAATMTRFRDVNGRGVATPFAGRYSSYYQRVNGMLVPASGEVEWLLPEGPFAYWRGRLMKAEYDFVGDPPTVAPVTGTGQRLSKP